MSKYNTVGGNVAETDAELIAIALEELQNGNDYFCLPWEESIEEAIEAVEADLANAS